MKAQSKKQKGSKFERKVAQMIRQSGLDSKARRRPLSGAEKMVRGYGDIISTLPFSIEAKHQKGTSHFWQWWEQARNQAKPMRPPLLVFSGNWRPVMVALEFKTFLDIFREKRDWEEAKIEAKKEEPNVNN